MLQITNSIQLDEREIEFDFILASGPGGQNVNRVATAVQLRFDVGSSPSLPRAVKERLRKLAGRRLTEAGILVIEARRFRSQQRNREDALERLVTLLQRAAHKPRPRRATSPSRAARQRRMDSKRRRGEKKKLRRPPRAD